MKNGYRRYKQTKRGFLNNMLGEKTAYIAWKSDIDLCENNFNCKKCKDKCSDYKMKRIDAHIEMKDCNTQLKFDFDIDGDSSETQTYIKNNMYKINSLIRELKKFKKIYKEQIDIMNENVKKLKTKKK